MVSVLVNGTVAWTGNSSITPILAKKTIDNAIDAVAREAQSYEGTTSNVSPGYTCQPYNGGDISPSPPTQAIEEATGLVLVMMPPVPPAMRGE